MRRFFVFVSQSFFGLSPNPMHRNFQIIAGFLYRSEQESQLPASASEPVSPPAYIQKGKRRTKRISTILTVIARRN